MALLAFKFVNSMIVSRFTVILLSGSGRQGPDPTGSIFVNINFFYIRYKGRKTKIVQEQRNQIKQMRSKSENKRNRKSSKSVLLGSQHFGFRAKIASDYVSLSPPPVFTTFALNHLINSFFPL